ncbi:hypothetical protein [Nocardioides sp. LS1]|uniref:hypothetical protein n=1 Tax=Nocardioides sp. LS1 TaxID=1027620 RepID=UPI000F620052|nr:hypothetical protein [Nocardioides sp. LS1]GCD89077.1 hypothetical protein NLS1_10830 [Nocardioides sp. LS1]
MTRQSSPGLVREHDAPPSGQPVGSPPPPRLAVGPLTVALGAVTLVASAGTVLLPDVLSGPAAMIGSARGTALVILVVGLPLLAASAMAAARGSRRGEIVVTGVTAYLLYNAVMFVLATPFNGFFLLYEAMLGLAILSLVTGSLRVWRRAPERVVTPARWVAVYIWVVAALNAAAWLAKVLPALAGSHPTDLLDGTGLTTNPVFVQDLAFWLPVMFWLGAGVWRADPRRWALAAAGSVFWVVEALGVAIDQAWGHAADPASSVASDALVPVFLVLALVGIAPAAVLLHRADPVAASSGTWRPQPHRSVLGWVAALNAVAAVGGAWGLASGSLDLGATIEARLPAGSPVLAAVALALAVALPNTALAVLALLGDRRTPLAAVVTGVVLVGWIVVELAFIRGLSFFHPLYTAIGGLLIWLGRSAAVRGAP